MVPTRMPSANQFEDMDPGGKDLEKMKESFKLGTLVAYLGSLKKKFLTFVIRCEKNRTPDRECPGKDRQAFEDIERKIKGWWHTIFKESAFQANEHYLNKGEQRITKEDFRAFFASSLLVEIERQFANPSKFAGIQQFTCARDYLITWLALSCGTRPRLLESATLQHFRDAGHDSRYDDCFVMLLPRHKRHIDGPAIVTMDEQLHKYIEIYIYVMRPIVVASQDEQHLFVKMEG